MNSDSEDKKIRRYLLNDLPAEARQEVEERLLLDDEYAEQMLMVEDELIDDYARDLLSDIELQAFERNFSLMPQRRQKLIVAEQMVKYAQDSTKESRTTESGTELAPSNQAVNDAVRRTLTSKLNQDQIEQKREVPEHAWWKTLFNPEWKIVAYAVLVLAVGVGIWWLVHRDSTAEKVLVELNRAYSKHRPVEARVTGFSYASYIPTSDTLGVNQGGGKGNEEGIDYVALDRAKNLLFGQNADASNPIIMQALGKYYLTQKNFAVAIDQFKKALDQAPNSHQLHSDLGAAYLGKIESDRSAKLGRRNEDVDECLKHLNRALELAPANLEALFNRALLEQNERLRRNAREDWKRYLQLDRESLWAEEARQHLQEVEAEIQKVSQKKEQLYNDFSAAIKEGDEQKILKAFSLSYSYNGNYIVEKLIDNFLQARLNARPEEATSSLQSLVYLGGFVAKNVGDYSIIDLAGFYHQAQNGQLITVGKARGLMRAAYSLYRNAENEHAVALYTEASKLFQQAEDGNEFLFANAWIGHCYHQLADTDNNLSTFSTLRPLLIKKKYRWMEANASCGLANGHNSAGYFSQAIIDCLRCREISEQLGDQIGKIRSMNMLGSFYYELGKHQEVLRLSKDGMDLSDQFLAEIRYSIAFYNLTAWSLSALSLHEAAICFQQEAIKMAEEAKSPRLIARSYIYLGLVYKRRGKYDEAIANAEHGISIGREEKSDKTGLEFVHTGLLNLGYIYLAAAKFTEALNAFDQVQNYFRTSKKQQFFYGAAKGRLMALIAQGRVPEGQVELSKVLSLYEENRRNIQEESNRNSFFDQEQGIYDIAIDFAYSKLGDQQQALSYSDLCRARSLFDLSQFGGQVTKRETPDMKIGHTTQPSSIEVLPQRLPGQVQLLAYAVLDSKLIAWVISQAGIKSQVIDIQSSSLIDKVNAYLASINQQPAIADKLWVEQANDLYAVLIQPVELLLDKQKQLFIIPDKILTRLPFGALISPHTGNFLIEDYVLGYASSAGMFLSSTERAQQKAGPLQERFMAVGNPRFDQNAFPGLVDLPTSENEVKASAALYKMPVLLIGQQAKKDVVLREMQRADVIHLAMHHVPDSRSPMLSMLPLSPTSGADSEAVIQAHEIYQLKPLQARLVVLSACQTRAEEYYGGEGAVGISRAFEAAGAPLIVASLWFVNPQATSELMVALHKKRRQNGMATIEALRTVQIEYLHRADTFRHPYYWAAFIPVGGYSVY